MERWKEDFPQKGKMYCYQQDVFSWCIQGTLKLLDVIGPQSQSIHPLTNYPAL